MSRSRCGSVKSKRRLFSESGVDLRRLPIGSSLSVEALKGLKYYYWPKSIKGSNRRLAWKATRMFLFFIGTAGLNAFTQEKILGQHPDTKLPKSCYGLIKTGAGWDWRALAVPMLFMAICTCISNVVARAKAFGSDFEGFCAKHRLNSEQKRRLLLIDKAFLKMNSFPSDGAENVFYISQDDIDFFGKDIFQAYMDLMYSREKFHLLTDRRKRDLILKAQYTGQAKKCNFINFNPEDISSRLFLIFPTFSLTTRSRDISRGSALEVREDESPDGERLSLLGHSGANSAFEPRNSRRHSTENSPECRHIPVNITLQRFDWRNFQREMKRVVFDLGWRGNANRLWQVFLWTSFKGFPAFQVILQLSKALHSLEKAFGIKDDTSPWILHALCLVFNLVVAFNRVLINNEMKGNEIYRLIEKRNTYKTYQLSPRETQRLANIKAVAASALPILVTILYFTFTSLFFASEGPRSLAEQIRILFPKSWGHAHLNPGFQSFLLNFITYGAVLSGLAVGIPTTCRAIHKELYQYFYEPDGTNPAASLRGHDIERGAGVTEGSAWKIRFCCPNITRGMLVFYVATFFDSTGFGFNAFYNSMQAMLAPSQWPITNKFGGCHFLLVLALTVAVGIAATNIAWTKYNGDKKYESFTGLWKKDDASLDVLVGQQETFVVNNGRNDNVGRGRVAGSSRRSSPTPFVEQRGKQTSSPQGNRGRGTPRLLLP